VTTHPTATPLDPQAQEAFARLCALVGGVRGRLLVQAAVVWSGWIGAAVSCAFLAALAALGLGVEGLAASAVAGSVLVLGIAASSAVVVPRTWRRGARTGRLADRVDASLGSDAVRTSLELVEEMDRGRLEDPWSRARLEGHLVTTAAAASSLVPAALTPWSRGARLSAVGPLALALCLALTHVPLVQQWLQRWSPLEGTSAVAVLGAPAADDVLRDILVELTPPPYTGEPPRSLPGGSGSFAALPGTQVRVEATAPVPLDSTGFRVGDGPWQAGEVHGDRLSLEFALGREADYTVQGQPAGGGEAIVSGPHRILAREDAHPHARLVEPPQGAILLDAGDRLPLDLEARDDFGLSRVERVIRRAGAEESRSVVRHLDPPGRTAQLRLEWGPGSETPGGDVELIYEVFDTDTVSGPKATATAPLRVRIMTEADRHALAVASLSELLDRTLAALGESLLWQSALDSGSRGDTDRVSERMDTLLASAGELHGALERDIRTDPLDLATVGSLVDDVSRAWDRLALQLAREADLGATSGVVVDHVHALERAALLLDRQLAAERWRAASATAQEATAAMQRLEDALQRGDQAAVDEAMRELAAVMARLQAELAAVNDLPALEIANPGGSGLDMMQQLADLLEQGKVDEAMALLEQTASSLGRMQGGEGEDASEILARLEAAQAEVSRLEGEQTAANADMDGIVRDHAGARLPDGLDELRERAARLGRDVQQLAEAPLAGRLAGALEGGLRRHGDAIEAADRALAEGDLDAAIRNVAMADGELIDVSQLARMFHEVAATGLDEAAYDRWQADLSRMEGEHLALIEDVLEAEQRWRRARADAAIPGSVVANQQRQIADGVAGLSADLEREVVPMLGDSVQRGMLDAAGQMMQAAAEDLELGRTERALSSGEDALERLRRVRDHLKQLQEMIERGGDSSGMALGAMAGWQYFEGSAAGRVEIPQQEDSELLEAIRRAALEAASEDAPPSYGPQNRTYYEELVR